MKANYEQLFTDLAESVLYKTGADSLKIIKDYEKKHLKSGVKIIDTTKKKKAKK